MSNTYHTPIINADPRKNDAAIWNDPLGELDAQIVTHNTEIVAARGSESTIDARLTLYDAVRAEIIAGRGVYGDLDARLDSIMLAGSNVATLANGAAAAAQAVVTVDSSTGFIAGGRVAYALAGGSIEYNVIDSVDTGTQITLVNNIGTGGIADNNLLAMISESEYQAAQAINSGGTASATLPNVVGWIEREVNVKAFGAFGDGSNHLIGAPALATAQAQYPLTHAAHTITAADEYDWCAIQEAILTADASGSSVENVFIPVGHYQINRTIVVPLNSSGRRIEIHGAGARGSVLSGTRITATAAITLWLIPGLTSLHDMYLIGADLSDSDSIAVRLGGSTTAGDPFNQENSVHIELDSLYFGDGWYRCVSALYEVDQLQITHCTSYPKVGNAVVYLYDDLAANLVLFPGGISPSAGVVIDQCAFTNTNATSGQGLYGVYMMGTENSAIRNSIIRGYDHCIYLDGKSGTRNHGLTLEGIHSEIDQTLKASASERWTPNTAYTVGDLIRPASVAANGWWYKCTTAGTTAATSIRTTAYRWVASSGGTNEYYVELAAGGDPSITLPHGVTANGTALTRNWVGRLAVSEWAYGDADSLGFNTIYVRLSDGADPDSKAANFVWTTSNEPTWPTTYAATVADGTAVWTAYKRSVFLETAVAPDVIVGGLMLRGIYSAQHAQFISHGCSIASRISMDGCSVFTCDVVYAQNYTAVRHTLFMQNCQTEGSIRPYPALDSTTSQTAITARFCEIDSDLVHALSTNSTGVSSWYTGEPNANQGGWVYLADTDHVIDPVNDTRIIVNAGSGGTAVIVRVPELITGWWHQGLRGKQLTIIKAVGTDAVTVTFTSGEQVLFNNSAPTTLSLADIGDSVTIAFDFMATSTRWFIVASYGI